MNYWPAEPPISPNACEPLMALVKDLARTGARTAKVKYGARGWVAHHNTDLWRATAPIDGAAVGHVADWAGRGCAAPVGPLLYYGGDQRTSRACTG